MPERRDPTRQVPRPNGRRASDHYVTTGDLEDLTGIGTDFWIGEIHDGRLPALVIERPGKRNVYRITLANFAVWKARYAREPSGGGGGVPPR